MIAALSLLAAVSGQQPAAALDPIGKWVVEYNATDCTISRRFGSPERPIVFGFSPRPTRVTGDVALILSDGGGGSGVRRGKGTITLLPANARFAVNWASGPMSGGRRGVRISVDEDFWGALPAAEAIRFDMGEDGTVTAALGSTKAALAAIKACGDDLLRHWGVDPAALVTLPPGAIVSWFPHTLYPPEARRRGEQGLVQAVASFGADGRPTGCRILVSSGSAQLDEVTCRVARERGRVPVAPIGTGVRYVYMPVRWSLEG